LEIATGDRVAIRGRNGCGKSTLLRVLGGLEKDYDGAVELDLPPIEVVYVHQTPCLFRGSVLQNVIYGLAARKHPPAQRAKTARRWLQALGIEELLEHNSGKLSGGEKRRVALARAFAIEPELLLLDEPFADLDQPGIDRVRAAILSVRSTVVLSSPVGLPDGIVTRSLQLDRT